MYIAPLSMRSDVTLTRRKKSILKPMRSKKVQLYTFGKNGEQFEDLQGVWPQPFLESYRAVATVF